MTEKNYNPEQRMKGMQKQAIKHIPEIAKHETKAEKEEEKKEMLEEKKEEVSDKNRSEKKEEEKKKTEKKSKRTEAVVNGKSVPISTLDSMFICKFIKRKTIQKAIADLEQVLEFKKPIPMKGEIPHRKGKIMSGRYPLNSVKEFIKLLKSLQANANVNGIDEPVIVEAVANMAYRPFGRFGRVRRKRTHIKIKVIEKKLIKSAIKIARRKKK
jgi:ribosomal protein L22